MMHIQHPFNGGGDMATYVTLIRFTEAGAKKFTDTCKREEHFKDDARKSGVTVRDAYWTLGSIDGLLIFDAPDDETATGAMLKLGAEGYVRTETCRAFNAAEMEKILKV